MMRIFSSFNSRARGQRLQPERRSGVRIITLKNAGWLALALTVLFVIFSAYMERRSRGTSSYGRLYDRRIDTTNPPPAPGVRVDAHPAPATAPPPPPR